MDACLILIDFQNDYFIDGNAAFDYGFNCMVVEDACATRDLILKDKTIKASDVHASFMAALSVPYAQVLTTSKTLNNMA